MYIVESYPVAVLMTIVTMLCWGSWANTQKLASREWGYPLFYWDYAIGVFFVSLVFAFTLGSQGEGGQSFANNLMHASINAILLALLGGAVFNIANLLIVAAIDIAGMAIAFPVGIGLALVVGVIVNYIATPLGQPVILFLGVALVTLAILLDALAYRKNSKGSARTKGIVLSVVGGILMGFFYRFVAASMSPDFQSHIPGTLTPYSAFFIFSIGIFISNFLFNTYFMYKPVSGPKVTFKEYFTKGTTKLHLIGIMGGVIWGVGMLFNVIAAGEAGFAISYGLGQGATMVAAIWGVFIWKEFDNSPKGTYPLLGFMFLSFLVGLGLIIVARVI